MSDNWQEQAKEWRKKLMDESRDKREQYIKGHPGIDKLLQTMSIDELHNLVTLQRKEVAQHANKRTTQRLAATVYELMSRYND